MVVFRRDGTCAVEQNRRELIFYCTLSSQPFRTVTTTCRPLVIGLCTHRKCFSEFTHTQASILPLIAPSHSSLSLLSLPPLTPSSHSPLLSLPPPLTHSSHSPLLSFPPPLTHSSHSPLLSLPPPLTHSSHSPLLSLPSPLTPSSHFVVNLDLRFRFIRVVLGN